MSLNDIQLSPSQLAEFYGKHLVTPMDNEVPGTVTRLKAAPQEAPGEQERPIIIPGAIAPRTETPASEAPGQPTTNNEQRTSTTVPYLGKNQKKIAILVSSPKEAHLPENELTFLTNVLQACHLNLGDVAIVNHARTPLTPAVLREQLESEYILVFGAPVHDPALSQQPSFVPLAQNGYSIVLVPSLTQLNSTGPEAKPLKQKLWICLKQLFNV